MHLRRVLQFSLLASFSVASIDLLQANDVLARRQDESTASNTATASNSQISSAQNSQSNSAVPSNSNSASNRGSSSGQTTDKPTASASESSGPALTTAKSIAQNAPAGGISMISPAPLTTAYYKVGQSITFVWNYTSLLAPPSAIDILVSCTASTYTLTQNASVAPTGTFVWDTNQYAAKDNPLVNAFYTMGVYDAASAYTAIPSPGHLANNGLQRPFGIYATQTPSVTNILECVTCTGGANNVWSTVSRSLLGCALGMAIFLA